MPGQEIDEANPPALQSSLPDGVLDFAVENKQLEKLDSKTLQSLKDFQQAACYIAGAMIFLRDNTLLEHDLKESDIKPRLLGHWGTCPGLIIVWSHINLLIQKTDANIIFVCGPGHGAPAPLAALWLEGSLEKFYPETYPRNRDGLHNLISRFSTPAGFPSHINAETPGAIHEGGELGYALAVSFGAVMDNPDLIVTCVVGDGEAESGPTAAAWHSTKYLDPAESGAVLPILHVNGFKISERTIFGCMDNKELVTLFSGYGYQVWIVDNLEDIDNELFSAMHWGISEIRKIQKAARSGQAIIKPRWPMLILRTPKGWTGPKKVDGQFIEGSFRSHQIPVPNANKDEAHLGILQGWLKTYDINSLLKDGKPTESILSLIPEQESKRLGQVKITYDPYQALSMPDWESFTVPKGGDPASSMATIGKFIAKVAEENGSSFRMFSPDELESNKLNAILDKSNRNFQWDQFSRDKGGRVIEILSEHCCQGFMQGYTLTGRTALFPSYESFLGIIHTMMVQYSKWNKVAREVKWRGGLSSINYIETSTWTRQEHNGYSHQQPSFIGAMLNLKAEVARIYFPPDANCFLSTVHHCLKSKDYINLMVGSKQPTVVYLSPEEAAKHCKDGVSIWDFASNKTGEPDVVLVGIGCEVTFEVIKAAELLRRHVPDLRVRVINVTDLMVLAVESRHPHALTQEQFTTMFTEDQPVYFNYHGYATELQGLLFGRSGLHRMTVRGYNEEGTTTTPFDMMLATHLSRFHVASWALASTAAKNAFPPVSDQIDKAIVVIDGEQKAVEEYIMANGKDPDDTYDMAKFE